MRLLRLGCLAFVGLVMVGAATDQARAGLVTEVNALVNQSGSVYQYNYTLSNAVESTLGASSFFLTVGETSNLFGIAAPVGWDVFYNPGDVTVEFASSSMADDIAPGTLGTFSISSLVAPRVNDYLVRGIDDLGGTFVDNTGLVLTPSFVPEPSSLLLAAIGLAGVVVGRVRGMRREKSNG